MNAIEMRGTVVTDKMLDLLSYQQYNNNQGLIEWQKLLDVFTDVIFEAIDGVDPVKFSNERALELLKDIHQFKLDIDRLKTPNTQMP